MFYPAEKLSFKSQGRTALFENGQKYYDESGIKMMMDTYQKNKKEIDIVSVGWVEVLYEIQIQTKHACRCVYKTGNTPMMSMHGKVVDFNHFHFYHSPITNLLKQGGGFPDMGQGSD